MQFELKVQAPQNQPVIWNFDELRSNLETALADYQNRVYTEDTIVEAKNDRAKLNKLKKAISDERISRKREYMKPFETFEDQAKELCDLIDAASSGRGEQLDAFEEKRVAEKTERIEGLFADIISNYDLAFITLDKIMSDKWLNKGTSEKTICEEITETCEKAIKDLEIIKRLPYAFEAESVYKDTLDLNTAIEQGERMTKVAEAKAEAIKATAESADTFEVSFKATLTKEQAIALTQFCKENGIKLEKI